MSAPVYDSLNYCYTTTFSSTISGGYPFQSLDYNPTTGKGTYLYGSESNYNFSNPNNMFEITYSQFCIAFPVHILATFDTVHSFVIYTEKDSEEEMREGFTYFDDDGEEYLYYKAEVNFYSHYGTTFEIKRIELF